MEKASTAGGMDGDPIGMTGLNMYLNSGSEADDHGNYVDYRMSMLYFYITFPFYVLLDEATLMAQFIYEYLTYFLKVLISCWTDVDFRKLLWRRRRVQPRRHRARRWTPSTCTTAACNYAWRCIMIYLLYFTYLVNFLPHEKINIEQIHHYADRAHSSILHCYWRSVEKIMLIMIKLINHYNYNTTTTTTTTTTTNPRLRTSSAAT